MNTTKDTKDKKPSKNSSKDEIKSIGKDLSKINIVSSFGFMIVGNVVFGLLMGMFFDYIFGTKKVFLIIFIVLGLISGLYNGFRYILKEVERYDKYEGSGEKGKEREEKTDKND
ncbi:MAG TPA: AtpZ/AtpI family protein [Fervidobacterium sp.]|nr:AtpZ/AtpI family protein [Fervidobacterium sp.]HPT54013.1 AtpZ/AtpI family protein [Fervidobacterium sp.]HPZ18033.1 AtpZ/AtpI family protein [Fervidobacterium sp.]HQE49262.1 AtpZ/AtpI family protein [Fervidobacterium sp.]HUM43047.1 AtpZ/AtpI family protein [Fervidobacterium sp.]